MTSRPRVGVIMGSDSDWSVMADAADALAEFDVAYEVGVVSAHRTPGRMLDYARSAADRGIEVVIAGAGGAAHLPGMVASATPLPVIGVPVPLARLDGLDSLLSIAQMPPRCTVSTTGHAAPCPYGERATSADNSRRIATRSSTNTGTRASRYSATIDRACARSPAIRTPRPS